MRCDCLQFIDCLTVLICFFKLIECFFCFLLPFFYLVSLFSRRFNFLSSFGLKEWNDQVILCDLKKVNHGKNVRIEFETLIESVTWLLSYIFLLLLCVNRPCSVLFWGWSLSVKVLKTINVTGKWSMLSITLNTMFERWGRFRFILNLYHFRILLRSGLLLFLFVLCFPFFSHWSTAAYAAFAAITSAKVNEYQAELYRDPVDIVAS